MTVDRATDGARVTVVVAHDRVGLLADVAAMLALQRASVRAARAWTAGRRTRVSVWEVADEHLDPTVLRQRLEAIVEPAASSPATGSRPADAAARADGRRTPRGVARGHRAGGPRRPTGRASLHLVLAALADLDVSVRSAHVDTLGPQAVDVFYVQEADAGALSERRAAEAAHAVREALTA